MPRKSVVKLTDRPDMALDVYRGRKTTTQQQQQPTTFINIFTKLFVFKSKHLFQIKLFNIKRNAKDVLCYTISLKLHYS